MGPEWLQSANFPYLVGCSGVYSIASPRAELLSLKVPGLKVGSNVKISMAGKEGSAWLEFLWPMTTRLSGIIFADCSNCKALGEFVARREPAEKCWKAFGIIVP